jgi:hypothetical protein
LCLLLCRQIIGLEANEATVFEFKEEGLGGKELEERVFSCPH